MKGGGVGGGRKDSANIMLNLDGAGQKKKAKGLLFSSQECVLMQNMVWRA